MLSFQGRPYVDWYDQEQARHYVTLQKRFQAAGSYQELADWINELINQLLRAAHGLDEDSYHYPLDLAVQWMRLMGMNDLDLGQCIDMAMDNMDQGIPPFPPDFPFDRYMVRDRIRQWQRKGIEGWAKSA